MSEIENILNYLCPRIIEYIKEAEKPDSKVGTVHNPLELLEEARSLPFNESPQGMKGLGESTEFLLQKSVVTWSNRFMEKLYAGNNPIGVASDILLSVLNTNSHVFSASPAVTVLEKLVSQKYANMFGFNGPYAGGLTFPGGSYSNLTSMQIARSIKFPETKEEGQTMKLAVFTSEHSHYSVRKAAVMLGLGHSSVFAVKVLKNGNMDVKDLKSTIIKAKSEGYKPFYINATSGTTVYGSFDDLEAIAKVASDHNIWLHVDGSWGGNVIFSSKYGYKLAGSRLADSITVNPQKMLGVPCTCSFLLLPDTRTFVKANSLDAGYLFHHKESDMGFDLADGTMGCGRRPDAVKFFLAWQYYGTQGYARRIEHAFAMTKYLYDKVTSSPNLLIVDCEAPQCFQVCFWYANKRKLENKEKTSQQTRLIAYKMLQNSQFSLDYSTHPTEGEFFRAVLNSPTVNEALIDELVETIQQIGATTI